MTILTEYEPRLVDPQEDLRYAFRYESVGAEAIEVFEVDTESNRRERVSRDDYSVEYQTGERWPIKTRGLVAFSRPHGDWVNRISIERNTLMDQTVDMPKVNPFNTRIVEFQLDKLTMIAQELSERKCDAAVSIPMTQEVIFGSYWDFNENSLNGAVDKLNAIFTQIKSTATDCSATPEEA